MTLNIESALLRGHMHGHQRNGNVDIEQHAAGLAMHVIVPFHPPVVAAGLVGKRQFLDQPMFREQMERAIDRAVPDVWITTTDSLEDLPGGEMRRRLPDNLQHGRTLSCVLEPLTWHDWTFRHPS